MNGFCELFYKTWKDLAFWINDCYIYSFK